MPAEKGSTAASEERDSKLPLVLGICAVVAGVLVASGAVFGSGSKDMEKPMHQEELEKVLTTAIYRGDSRFEGMSNHELRQIYQGVLSWDQYRRRHHDEKRVQKLDEVAARHYAKQMGMGRSEKQMEAKSLRGSPVSTSSTVSNPPPVATPPATPVVPPPSAPPPAPATGASKGGKYAVGDKVRVRDSDIESWNEGHVTALDQDGTPVVAVGTQKRGFHWKFIEPAS
eukprot:TRINITY_DN40344_c0_g1_i1.p2 TRINITY_DN40344_c0_g1~~TRINITY_DN40344_c0_g1_i1.p2  ORF type:complete len:227 (+),score=79.27 TRINITY_DN40344_c0_g1_i1:64-744(+)